MAESVLFIVVNFVAGWLLAKRRFITSLFTVLPFIFRTLLEARTLYPSHFIKNEMDAYLDHIKRADTADRTFRQGVWQSDLSFTEKLTLLKLGEVEREKYALDKIEFLDSQKIN